MTSSKEEKPHSRSRRHSGIVVVHQSKKSKKHKKDKDSDSSSLSSSSSSSDTIVVPPRKCPLRFMLAGMFETEGEPDDKNRGCCPLRKVQLWHTIPLCLLAIINLLLVIIALLGVAGYRIAMGVQAFVVTLAKSDLDCNPYAEHHAESDTGSTIVAEKS